MTDRKSACDHKGTGRLHRSDGTRFCKACGDGDCSECERLRGLRDAGQKPPPLLPCYGCGTAFS